MQTNVLLPCCTGLSTTAIHRPRWLCDIIVKQFYSWAYYCTYLKFPAKVPSSLGAGKQDKKNMCNQPYHSTKVNKIRLCPLPPPPYTWWQQLGECCYMFVWMDAVRPARCECLMNIFNCQWLAKKTNAERNTVFCLGGVGEDKWEKKKNKWR